MSDDFSGRLKVVQGAMLARGGEMFPACRSQHPPRMDVCGFPAGCSRRAVPIEHEINVCQTVVE